MYELERSSNFSGTINALREEFPRIDAPIDAVCSLLCIRGGEGFGIVSVRDWHYFKVEAAPGVPGLNVFFSVDEQRKKVFLVRADRIILAGDDVVGGDDEG
jgi:hypothetical protein